MKKFILFPIWEIEKIEDFLERQEENGLKLTGIKNSSWFLFKESDKKRVSYFLSYISPWGQNMTSCDYAILSEHKGNIVKNAHHFFYEFYKTACPKEELNLLYGIRLDFIKRKIIERIIIGFLTFILMLFGFIYVMKTGNQSALFVLETILFSSLTVVSLVYTIYCLFGLTKQQKKIKKWEAKYKN